MKENENKEQSSTAGAAKGGNTSNESVGSAVSTAIGEPVAWMQDDRMLCTTAESKKKMETAGFGKWAEIAKRYTIPLYLAAPTQVSAPQADIAAAALAGIERAEWYAVFSALRDARTYLCKDGVRHTWLDGAVALAEERAKGKGTYSSAPQASAAQEVLHEDVEWLLEAVDMARRNPEHATKIRANCKAGAAQEVRAVPEGWREVIQGMRDASYTITQYSETADVVFDSVMDALDELEAAPTSTSTAPAAMDEKGGAK